MSFYNNIGNFSSEQDVANEVGAAKKQGQEDLIKKNSEKDLPAVKITNPKTGAKVKQSTATKFQFQVKNIAKVQVLADIPGGFGKVGEPIDTSKKTDFDITFNVPGKRKVKLQGLNVDGKPLEGSNPFDIIDIEVVTAQQLAEEQLEATEESNKQKEIADLQFDRSVLKSQQSALAKKKTAVKEAKTKLDEAKEVAANTAPGPLKKFYEDRIPGAQDDFDQAEADFIASGGQIQLDKLADDIKKIDEKIAEIQFGDGETTPVATENPLVKKATDPKEVGKKEDVQTTVTTESEETKELLEAIKETESNEAITKSQFNVEKVKEELELAIAGKQQSGKVVIEDVDNVDKTRLRSIDKLGKYLEDPIAFMGNYVWNYDILNPTRMVFRYALPQNIIIQINKKTNEFVQETIKFLNEEKNKQTITAQSKEVEATGQSPFEAVFDYYFIAEFSKRVRAYFEQQFPNKDFSFLESKIAGVTQGSLDGSAPELVSQPFVIKNIRFFWLWWNQVFYVNTPIFKDKFFFTIDENNVIPVNCALYFLEKLFNLTGTEDSIEKRFNFVKADLDSEQTKLIFNSDIFKLDYLGSLTNTNNYINKKDLPTVGVENIVNVVKSPFFLLNFSNLSEKEKKDITNTKTVKKCKEIKDDKFETSLKLFYKEGNDNILDKDKPETGLGCDTTTTSWVQANHIMFSPKSLDAKIGRVNFKLPYYNKLMIQTKNAIPNKLDIYQQGLLTSNASDLTAYNKSFEGLSSEIILLTTRQAKSNILIDNELLPSFNTKGANALIDQYFNRFPNWGPQYIINNIPFFNPEDTPFFKLVMLPYIGAFNAGYQIDKRLANTGLVRQSYYINSSTPAELLNLFDSQVKYGRNYNYNLSQIISFVDIRYSYKNPKLSVVTQTVSQTEQTEDVTQGVFAPTADTDPNTLFGTGNITSKTMTFEFETTDITYSNSVEAVGANDITSPISYVDLPPPAPFLRVYPERGVNNKVLLSFQKFSQSNKVDRKIIPRKYWTEGWEDARKFFIETSENTPEIFKNLAGDVTVTNAEDEMFFADQDVFLAKIYFSKGEKPTDILELEELEEINLFTDGFTREVNLEPNNKYYFAAKFVSFTGLESYYSEVYEIELVDDGGTVFPVINVVTLEQKVERKTQITFDKKFRIQPALLQQAPNLAKNDIGYLSPSVFTSPSDTKVRFKVRLTSKSTGRKADFNVIYRKDFKLQSRDAGPLNVNRTTKDKVLISYKFQPLTNEEVAELIEPTIGQGAPIPKIFLNLPNINITADKNPDDPKKEVIEDNISNACCSFTTVGKNNLYARQVQDASNTAVKTKADNFWDLGLTQSPNETSVKQFANKLGIAAGTSPVPGLTDISELNSNTGNIFPINFNDINQVPILTYVLYLLYTTISQGSVKRVKGNPYLDPNAPFTANDQAPEGSADYLNTKRNELFCFLCKRTGTSNPSIFPTPARLIEQFLKNNDFVDFSENDKYLGGIVDCRKYGFVNADGFGTPKLVNSTGTTDNYEKAFKCNTSYSKVTPTASTLAPFSQGELKENEPNEVPEGAKFFE
jgi:hypothetical protein